MQLTPDQVAAYAYQAGFRGQNLVTAVAIAAAESTLNPNANNHAGALGLWQIESLHVPAGKNPDILFNPLTNAQYAYKLSGGSNFSAWQTYEYPPYPYKQYLGVAQLAVARMSRQPTTAVIRGTVRYTPIRVVIDALGTQKPWPAIAVNQGSTTTTYLQWNVLDLLSVPNRYLGGGMFLIKNPTTGTQSVISGVSYKGVAYIAWNDVPGLGNPKTLPGGGLSFTGKAAFVGVGVLAAWWAWFR